MRDVKGLDFSNPEDYLTIAKKVDDVIKEHPEMIELFKLSEYRDWVGAEKPPIEIEQTE